MKNRPLIFILIALMHMLEPIVKIAYFKMTTPFSLLTIMSNISSIGTAKEIFDFWFLFPIGGIALLGVKRWSYPIFVGVQVYNIYNHLSYEKFTWPYVSDAPFYGSLFLLIVNVFIVIYFSLPDIRKPFFNKAMRWWETRTRYDVKIPIHFSINNPNHLISSEVMNISDTGIFINYRGVIENDTKLIMHLAFGNHHIQINGKKVSDHNYCGQKGIGVQFCFENIWEKLELKSLVRTVAKEDKKKKKAGLHLAA